MDALSGLVAYCLQLTALSLAAYVCAAALKVRTPSLSLRYWQSILAAALLLRFLQPVSTDSHATIVASATANPFDSPNEAIVLQMSGQAMRVALWIVGIGIALRITWLIVGLLRVRSLVRSAAPDAALSSMDQLQDELGTRATLLVTDDLEGPATIGVRRPVVLLPRSLRAMPAAVQRAIVCHELVHVRRRDWLHTIGEEVWCAALWFHPAARLIASQLSLAREMVVDETTLTITRDRRAYAEALLAFAFPQPHVIGVTPFIGRRTLSQRISQIAEEGSMSRRRALASLAFALVASVAATAATADRLPIAVNASTRSQGTIYDAGPGISLPVVIAEVKPGYTRAAMDAKVQGSVFLWVVINEAGDVSNVAIKQSLDEQFGLDAKAIEAAYKWKFKPGYKGGKAVSVRVTIEMTFKLK